MLEAGLEPTRIAPLAPKASVYTNFTTPAFLSDKRLMDNTIFKGFFQSSLDFFKKIDKNSWSLLLSRLEAILSHEYRMCLAAICGNDFYEIVPEARPETLPGETWEYVEGSMEAGWDFAASLLNNPPKAPIGLVGKSQKKTAQHHRQFTRVVEGLLRKETGLTHKPAIDALFVALLVGIQELFWSFPEARTKQTNLSHFFFSAMGQQALTRLLVSLSGQDSRRLVADLQNLSTEEKNFKEHVSGAISSAVAVETLCEYGARVFEMPLYFDIVHAGDLLVLLPDGRVWYLQVKTQTLAGKSRFELLSESAASAKETEDTQRHRQGAAVFQRRFGIEAVPVVARVKLHLESKSTLAQSLRLLTQAPQHAP